MKPKRKKQEKKRLSAKAIMKTTINHVGNIAVGRDLDWELQPHVRVCKLELISAAYIIITSVYVQSNNNISWDIC